MRRRWQGLIYLDAGYSYAYYNAAVGDTMIDLIYLQRAVTARMYPIGGQEQKARVKEFTEISVPRFERELQTLEKRLQTMPDSHPLLRIRCRRRSWLRSRWGRGGTVE
jgi:hypothetical protein